MTDWQQAIARTGFLTSLASYALFWLADLARPGFVARYVSVHVFLLSALVFGAWWVRSVREYRDWPFFQYALALVCGVVLGAAVWHLGSGFEAYRLLAVAGACLVPSVALSVIRSS